MTYKMFEKTRNLDASTFSSKIQIPLTKKVIETFDIKANQRSILMLESSEEKVGVLIGI